MKKGLFIIFILFSAIGINAQDYRVPDRMIVGGIRLRINDAARRNIQQDVDLLTGSPKYWEIKAERARTYFPIIERIFKEAGVPEEFKYLVLQESALISDAVSTSNAVGFWQMKDFTAMEFGLRVDNIVDERKSIISSTEAAARYFLKAEDIFDNWLHALQSYQMGIAGAEKFLGNKDRGATSMNITMNTYWYVRKYLAHIIAYETVLEKPASIPVSEYANAEGQSLHEISRKTGVPLEELKEYNKWLKHSRIPDDKEYIVILPGEFKSTSIVLSRESPKPVENIYITDRASEFPIIKENKYKDHKYIIGINGLPGIIASSTDNVNSLAVKGELSIARFKQINDLNNDRIIPGQVYYFKRKKKKAATHYHAMSESENLWYISQKYGVQLKSILTKNRIKENEIEGIKTGRVLWLRFIRPNETPVSYVNPEPLSESAVVGSVNSVDSTEYENLSTKTPDTLSSEIEIIDDYFEPEDENSITVEDFTGSGYTKKIHTVSKSETFYSISNRYGSTVVDLLNWNHLQITDKLSIGQELLIYLRTDQRISSEPDNFIYHTVKPGETMFALAREYKVTVNDLLLWNDKTDSSLRIGEKIKIIVPR